MKTSTTRQMIMGVFLRKPEGDVSDAGSPSEEEYDPNPQHDFEALKGKGLLAGIDDFVAGGKGKTTDKSGKKDEKFEVIDPEEEEEEEEESREQETEDEEEEEDDDFPSFGDDSKDDDSEDEEEEEDEDEEETPAKGFDQKAFDKQTEEIVKAIEKAGHPGAVFKKLRAELRDLKKEGGKASAKEVTKLQKQIQELEPYKAEVEGLRERVKKVTSRNSELMVAESEEYQQKVDVPMKAMEETIIEMAKAAGLEPDLLFDAVLERNAVKQDELLESLSKKIGTRGVGRLERFSDDMRGIELIRKNLIKNADKVVEANRKAETARLEKEKQEQAAEFRDASNKAFEKYAAKIPGFTDAKGRLTELGKAARRKALSVDRDKLTIGDQAFAVFSTEAMAHLVRENRRLSKEVSTFKAGGKGKQDRVAGGKPAGKTGASKATGPMGLEEHMRRHFPAPR